MVATDAASSTADRLLVAALAAFADRGYEAASLDEIASACDVRKQTLLYHFPSKEALLESVIEHTVIELAERLRSAAEGANDRQRAMVDALFRVGAERPELLEFVREALRLGPPASQWLQNAAEPFVEQLESVIERDKVIGVTAIILGMATEADVSASLGARPSLAQLRRRRRVLLNYLDD